jgi:hypothetical protein
MIQIQIHKQYNNKDYSRYNMYKYKNIPLKYIVAAFINLFQLHNISLQFLWILVVIPKEDTVR